MDEDSYVDEMKAIMEQAVLYEMILNIQQEIDCSYASFERMKRESLARAGQFEYLVHLHERELGMLRKYNETVQSPSMGEVIIRIEDSVFKARQLFRTG
jgi:hypothetical protein